MREILFRGQTRRKGEKVYMGTGKPVDGNWVYGGITQGTGDFSVMYSYDPVEKHVVYTDTIGQFTGLTDKNGKKIFEGDIVVSKYSNGEICCIGDVQFDFGVFGVEWSHNKKNRGMVGSFGQKHNLRKFDDGFAKNVEIVGNIHDNPELLEDEDGNKSGGKGSA